MEKQLRITNYELQIEGLDELKELNELNVLNELNELEELKELIELNELNKLISDDPIMKKMKEGFDKANIKEEKSDTKIKISKQDAIETEKMNSRARENIFKSKFAYKDENEKEKRRMEDIALIMNKGSADSKLNENNTFSKEYRLSQNYPNPFNPVTKINYSIPVSGNVSVKVFDMLGKELMTLINGFVNSGDYVLNVDGSNLPSGIYFYKLESGKFSVIKKMALIK